MKQLNKKNLFKSILLAALIMIIFMAIICGFAWLLISATKVFILVLKIIVPIIILVALTMVIYDRLN